MVYQLGLPPRRIDLMTSIDGLSFAEASVGQVMRSIDGADVPFIGREALIANKRSSGRPKDLIDLTLLTGSSV